MNLQPGQNVSISKQTPHARGVEVVLAWEPAGTPLEIDTSAFALTAEGKVRSDQDFVFYNQPELPGGGIRRAQDGKHFEIYFDKLPGAIEKIALTLTVHEGQRRGQSFSQLSRLRVELLDAQSKASIATFEPATGGMAETAVIAAEIYRRNEEWKFRAVGQGFVGGLAPLARNYGVDVADEQAPPPEPAAPQPPSPAAARAQPAPPPSTPPPASPVRLGKITLDKKGQSISLEKKGRGFERIEVNLNWSRHPAGASAGGGGFFGRMLGSQKGIDLDLGCLLQLQDGRAGAVQALGNSFGALDEPPFIQLMGDDRTGDSAQGEFLYINGRHWDQLKKVLIFAFIYEGAPNWAAAEGVVTIKSPGQPTLEVRLDEHRSDRGMCAIALLENVGGDLKVSKQVEYFRNHKEMDEAFGFGLRWKAGSKD